MDRAVAVLLAVFVALPCFADTIAVRRAPGGAPGECVSCSLDTEYDNHDFADSISSTQQRGQSFKFSQSGDACSVSFSFGSLDSGGPIDMILRFDDDTNMSSEYLIEVQETVSSTGWNEFNFATPVAVSAGTIYFAALLTVQSGNTSVDKNNDSALYTDGNRLTNSDSDWEMSNDTTDLAFRIALCD